MSLVLEDLRSPNFEKAAPSQFIQSEREKVERHGGRMATKARVLRLDSPTTIEACRQLGLLVDDLREKTIDDFRGPKVDEEIAELRFGHYKQKYAQFVKDVWGIKRQLIKAQQRNEKLKQLVQAPFNLTNITSAQNTTRGGTSRVQTVMSPNVLKHSSSVANISLPGPLAVNYNKALSYFKSHDTSEVKNLKDIVGNEGSVYGLDDTTETFDSALAQEVMKFNKIKMRKQKEAKNAFEEEVKRAYLLEDLKEKEKRKKELQKRQALEQKKIEEERKLKAEEKLEKIKEADRIYEQKKLEQKEKINLKLNEVKKKLAEETERKRKLMEEQEEKLEEKRKQAEERLARVKQDELARCDEINLRLQERLGLSSERHNASLNEKISKAKFKILKIEENVKKTREMQEKEEEEYMNRLVSNLVKRDTSLKSFQQKHLKEIQRRQKEAASKTARFLDHQATISQNHEDNMAKLTERFQKAQEILGAKRSQEEKELRLKQELNRLRIVDKQENYQRKIRQVQYEQQQILDKEKYHEEKLLTLKQQKEVLQRAKIEASIQAKVEKDKIDNEVLKMTKLKIDVSAKAKLSEEHKSPHNIQSHK